VGGEGEREEAGNGKGKGKGGEQANIFEGVDDQ